MAGVLGIAASFALRALHADGAGYLLSMIRVEWFSFAEPSRRSVHFVQQLPTILAIKAGVSDVHALIVLYGLTMHLLPLLFVASCSWILPKDRKALLLFPLVHYLAGTLGSFFTPLLEGPVAAAYFWPLLFLLLFRFEKKAWLAVTCVASVALLYMHEVYVFLGPLLAMAAAMAALSSGNRYRAAILWGLTAWYLCISVVALGFILEPRSITNRDTFVMDLLGLRWLVTGYGAVNAPIALGLLALCAGLLIPWIEASKQAARPRWVADSVLFAFGGVALITALSPVLWESTVRPVMQFMSRYHSALISLPLGGIVLATIRWPAIRRFWSLRRHVILFGLLALGSLGWHGVVLSEWSGFIRDYSKILRHNHGLLEWETALESLETPEERMRFQRMSWPWTNPAMSLLLAPEGKVAAVVDNPEGIVWERFDPKDLDRFPRIRLIDTSIYEQEIQRRFLHNKG